MSCADWELEFSLEKMSCAMLTTYSRDLQSFCVVLRDLFTSSLKAETASRSMMSTGAIASKLFIGMELNELVSNVGSAARIPFLLVKRSRISSTCLVWAFG